MKTETGSGDVTLMLGRDASFEARADQGSGDLVNHYADATPIAQGREVIGYKRGPVMLGILFSGIILGSVAGFGAQYATYFAQLPAEYQITLGMWLQSVLPMVLISAGAACFGAYQRLH